MGTLYRDVRYEDLGESSGHCFRCDPHCRLYMAGHLEHALESVVCSLT